ncbi:hypothetical protein OH491_05700 [Termitidicoccus mucosus]|uniref:Protein kinase domain-containing protein n=1 Tax=Termitidicoccus mucosus TaxID=1184151 RepID=A0A178IE82_9BACT|nr:hypothetical protein AW736_19275 [Opitutaceae bacterium TSB47]
MGNNEKIIILLNARYAGERFSVGNLKLLRAGRYGNAHVYRYRDARHDLVVKDFSHCPWWFRWTLGRFYVQRECLMLTMLEGVPGVAGNCRKLGPYMVSYDFIEGETLTDRMKRNATLPASFFVQWYELTKTMHKRGVVHLDTRNLSNVLCSPEGQPCVIDFQSALRLRFWPGFIRRIMVNTDVSAVCKGWLRLCSKPPPPELIVFYERFTRWRKFWIFKGYPLRKLKANWKNRQSRAQSELNDRAKLALRTESNAGANASSPASAAKSACGPL